MHTTNILITGGNRGLGFGLCQAALSANMHIHNVSRNPPPIGHPHLHHYTCDLSQLHNIEPAIITLFKQQISFDLLVLNAGILGDFGDLSSTSIDQAKTVMDINLWSNKILLDLLIKHRINPAQVVFISSGAAVSGNRGWNSYALSKAALNMLCQQYAYEFPNSHFCAIAPGIIDTDMQTQLCDGVSLGDDFPAIAKLRAARYTSAMPTPNNAGAALLNIIPTLRHYPSGSFHDIRDQLLKQIP